MIQILIFFFEKFQEKSRNDFSKVFLLESLIALEISPRNRRSSFSKEISEENESR